MSSPPRNHHRPSRFKEGEPLTGYPSTTGSLFSNIIIEQDMYEALRRSRQGSSSTSSTSSTSSSSSLPFSTPHSCPTNTPPPSHVPRISSQKRSQPLESAPVLQGATTAQFDIETEKRGKKNDTDVESAGSSRSEKVKGHFSKALIRGRERRAPVQTDDKLSRRIR